MVELGPYVLLEPHAGDGGAVEVWRAVHEPTDTPLTVKITRDPSPELVDPILARAAVMSSLRSPYLVAVHDFGKIDHRTDSLSRARVREGCGWMVTEWLPGGSVTPALVTDWWSLRRTLLDLLLGLAHAHARGVLHLGLRPAKVLVASTSPLRVKLTDFGLASGAPLRSAPEQREVTGAVGPWTDLYLVGSLIEELVGDRIDTGALEVPSAFDAWRGRLSKPAPADRPLTVAAAIDGLLALDRVTRLHRRHWSTELEPESPPPRGAADPGPAVFAHRRPPLVGRAAEREVLWELLYSVTVDGRPRVVLVHGPSGVGTTALATWLVERVLEAGSAVVARGTEVGDDPLAGLLADRFGVAAVPADARGPALRVHLHGSTEPWVDAVVAWLTGHGSPDRAQRFSLASAALRHWGGPTVVWVEGYAAGELVDFARSVLSATSPPPVLFVFTEADERLGGASTRPALDVVDVPLGRLAPEVVVELVRSFGALDEGVAVRLAARSAGFPSIAVDILRQLARTGGLRSGPAGWRANRRRPLPEASDPGPGDQWLDDVLAKVPRSLPALTVAAVLGLDATLTEWRQLCRATRILIPATLVATLERQHLGRSEPSGGLLTQLGFVDAVLRRTAERGPSLHRAAAELLTRRGANPVRIGLHWFHAGDLGFAREWLEQGVERGNLALVEQGVALDRLDELIPVDDRARAPLLYKRIERARVSGRVDAALEAIRKLLVLARRYGDATATSFALRQRAVLRLEGGDEAGALRDIHEAAAVAGTVPSEWERAEARSWLGLVLARTGRLAEAREVLEPLTGYLPSYGLGAIALDAGDPMLAMRHFDAARTQSPTPLNVALLQNAVAQALCETGRPDSAEKLALDSVERLVALQSMYVGEARVAVGFACLAQSRWSAAELALRSALGDNEDARRVALAGLALATAGLRRDPMGWLQQFPPRGPRMSLSRERAIASALDRLAETPGVSAAARSLAMSHASVVLARAQPA